MLTSVLRGRSPVQEVKPMFGCEASARRCTISAVVWPWAAQCILFCTDDQQLSMGNALRFVDPEHIDRRSGGGRLARECGAIPLDVIRPVILPRIEEGDQIAAFWIIAGHIRSLEPIALGTRQAKVARCAPPVMFLRLDVIHFMRQRGAVLRKLTILATSLCLMTSS
jgi:hypothetical protein